MSKRPLLLINGRWVRLDGLISMNTRAAADPTIPATADLVYVHKGKPDRVYRASGLIEQLSIRRSGRQMVSITNQE
jgi:hypothetical protein